MTNQRPRMNLAQPVRVTNAQTVNSAMDRLRRREADLRARLKDGYHFAEEFHTPAGTVIRIGQISYYDDDTSLTVQGTDLATGEICQVIVPVQNFQVVFRIYAVEDPTAERKPIGFRIDEDPELPEQLEA